MGKSNNAKTTTAQLAAGSAERTIEDRAPALDGVEVDVSDLQQPDTSDDRNAISMIFDGFQAAFTSEHQYTNPNTGELAVSNKRLRALRIIAKNFVQQMNYALEVQLKEAQKCERMVIAAKEARKGDEDGSLIASREAWFEREVDTFRELCAMRDAALNEYATLLGYTFDEKKRGQQRTTLTADLKAMI